MDNKYILVSNNEYITKSIHMFVMILYLISSMDTSSMLSGTYCLLLRTPRKHSLEDMLSARQQPWFVRHAEILCVRTKEHHLDFRAKEHLMFTIYV